MIDTQVANTLFHLPETPPELAVRTLLRGARIGLPSGEKIAEEVCKQIPWAKVLTQAEIVTGKHQDILTRTEYGLLDDTPLWYYLLKEAELNLTTPIPPATVGLGGRSLGPVGSYLVASVFLDILLADPDSYLSAPGWTPTLPTMPGTGHYSFTEIIRFVSTGHNNT
jgi:hypothetical protein